MSPADPAALERAAAILRERARHLAGAQDAEQPGEQIEILLFQLAWETYAVETCFVREVHPLEELTRIPCTPGFVLGVINLRGELCPVIELKQLFGLPVSGITNATSAIILQDEAMEFGLVADVIIGVQMLGLDQLHEPPATFSGINAAFLKGVTGERLAVLDAHNLLTHPRLVVNEQVGE